LRWLTVIPLALVLASSLVLTDYPLVKAFLLVQLLFYGLAAMGGILVLLGRSGASVFSVPFYILLTGTAGIAGVFDTCRGRRFSVWEIATLSRGTRELVAREVAQPSAANSLRGDRVL
jgi:uncharacterized membrane protein YpjA